MKASTAPIASIAIISNAAQSLSNFRGPLIAAMAARGWTVHALAPDYDADLRATVRALGANPVDIDLDRTGIRPLRDIAATIRLARVLRQLGVDATFTYFIKPVIFGTLAATLARVPHRFALVAGLGYIFTDGGVQHWRRRLLRLIASLLYRLAFTVATRVFFQNADDQAELSRITGLVPGKAVLTNGTGVDLIRLQQAPVASGTPVFLYVGRLLREKGVEELVEAARIVRARHPDVRVRLVGGYDVNPGSFDEAYAVHNGWQDVVELPGHVSDVMSELRCATVFVLPSWREGKPRSTQEALAVGRAVITTDAPGCRDTVVEGDNGFLVPVRAPASLAEAMLRFVENPSLAVSMGARSRTLAEIRFDTRTINVGILDAMESAATTSSCVTAATH